GSQTAPAEDPALARLDPGNPARAAGQAAQVTGAPLGEQGAGQIPQPEPRLLHRQGRASPRLSAAPFHPGGAPRRPRRRRSPDRSPTRPRGGPLKGASPSRASQARMRPTGFSFLIHLRESSIMENVKGKSVAVLVEKFYEDLELWYPVLRLREAGCTVR